MHRIGRPVVTTARSRVAAASAMIPRAVTCQQQLQRVQHAVAGAAASASRAAYCATASSSAHASKDHEQPPAFKSKHQLFGSKTKIVCTIGPASSGKLEMRRMIQAGMDVARMNFSHGKHHEHAEIFHRLREVSLEDTGDSIAILCDIQGPKIRVGEMTEQIIARIDQEIWVTDSESATPGAPARGGPSKALTGPVGSIQIKLPGLVETMNAGDPIFINDGIVKLTARERHGDKWLCVVDAGGVISSNKGCNLPNAPLHVEVLTEKDKVDLEFIVTKLKPDFVAVSFVGTAKDVLAVREYIDQFKGGKDIKLIPKIERKMALDNIDEIIAVSDGVMVARGDLGVEVEGSDVPWAQKMLTRKCNQASIPCIVATQMLESMTHSQRPTRAETNDVFNAVHDGADAVMLSGETSVGVSPVHVVQVMDEIVAKAEKSLPYRNPREYVEHDGKPGRTECTGLAVYELCRTLQDSAKNPNNRGRIICLSDADDGGFTARMIAKYRPIWNIIVVTRHRPTARVLSLLWGVQVLVPSGNETKHKNHDEQVLYAVRAAMDRGLVGTSHTCIVVGRSMLGHRVGTSMSVLNVGQVVEAVARNEHQQ